MNNFCWITLLATDNFCGGVKMLNDSLKKVNTKYPLYVIATNNLSQESFDFLDNEKIPYKVFPYISFFCDGERNMRYWADLVDQRENVWWNCTMAKNYIFLFNQYQKVCFVDADVEFVKNCDHYFDYPTPASFDIRWADGIHGSMILVEPNLEDFFTCMNIACDIGIVNDEMVWYRWKPYFKQMTDHIFPIEDYYGTGDMELNPEATEYRLKHWDGFEKPWFKNP